MSDILGGTVPGTSQPSQIQLLKTLQQSLIDGNTRPDFRMGSQYRQNSTIKIHGIGDFLGNSSIFYQNTKFVFNPTKNIDPVSEKLLFEYLGIVPGEKMDEEKRRRVMIQLIELFGSEPANQTEMVYTLKKYIASLLMVSHMASALPVSSLTPKKVESVFEKAEFQPIQLPGDGKKTTDQSIQKLTQLSNTTLNIDGTDIKFGTEYSKLRGALLKFGVVKFVGDSGALAVDFRVGKEEKEILLQYGLKVTEGAMIKVIFAGHEQFMNFAFPSGTEGTNIQETTKGIHIRIRGNDVVKFVELMGFEIVTKGHDFGPMIYTINTDTITEIYNDARRVAGGKMQGFQTNIQLLISNTNNITFDITGGIRTRTSDTVLPTPKVRETILGGKLAFDLIPMKGWRGYIGYRQEGSGTNASKSLQLGVEGNGIRVELSDTKSNGTRNPRMSVSVNIPLNPDFTPVVQQRTPGNTPKGASKDESATPHLGKSYLLSETPLQSNISGSASQRPSIAWTQKDVGEFVGQRPDFVPKDITNIQIDPSNITRLLRVEKTGVPKGTEVNSATGVTSIPLPENPGVIESAVNLANMRDIRSAFSVRGNMLDIQTRGLESTLVAGVTNTLEVKLTNIIIRINTLKGSVVITGTEIVPRVQDAPTNILPPTVTPTQTGAEIKINISDTDGVRNMSCQIQTESGTPLGSPLIPIDGVCKAKDLTSLTNYRVITRAEVKEENQNGTETWKLVETSPVGFVTLAGTPPNTPSTPLDSNPSFGKDTTVFLEDHPLTQRLISNSPGVITYSSSHPKVATVNSSGQLTYHAVGTTVITATQAAYGSYGPVSLSYTLRVEPAPIKVNNPPAFPSMPTVIATAGVAGSVVLPAATDADGEQILYNVGTLPSGFSFDTRTLTLSWTTAIVSGNSSFTLTATDGNPGSMTSVIIPIQVNAPVDTVAPTLISGNVNFGVVNIGSNPTTTLNFSENLASLSVGSVPTGMNVSITGSGSTRQISVSTNASFTSFGAVTIPITVTDAASNSGNIYLSITVNDVAPVAGGAFAALTNMTISDNQGLSNIIAIDCSGVTDPLGRNITYSATGLPVGITISSLTGMITGLYDASAPHPGETFTVTITARNPNNTLLQKTFVLTIRDDG